MPTIRTDPTTRRTTVNAAMFSWTFDLLTSSAGEQRRVTSTDAAITVIGVIRSRLTSKAAAADYDDHEHHRHYRKAHGDECQQDCQRHIVHHQQLWNCRRRRVLPCRLADVVCICFCLYDFLYCVNGFPLSRHVPVVFCNFTRTAS